MRLNHLNVCVDDLDEAQAFFCHFFDFRLLDCKGDALAVMTDGHGFTLVLSNVRAFGGEAPPRYPEGFHVGFVLETPEQVDRTHERLCASGADVGREPRKMRGSYGFYFTALGEVLFEVSCPL